MKKGRVYIFWIFGLVILVGLSGLGVIAWGQEDAKEEEAWKQVNTAAKRAVGYLLSQQRKDGSITDTNNHQTTMTALAIMGMMSVGHKVADRTDEGEALRKALAYVLRKDRQDEHGYFGSRDGSRMYGHGIITLMLAEVLGMGEDEAQDRLVRERLQKAIDLILKAQAVRRNNKDHQGGWRYNHNSTDSDMSVTAWQLIALKAAKNAGLEVPKEAIKEAVAYVKRSYQSKRDPNGRPLNPKSFFTYTPRDNRLRFGSSAGGFLSLQICGEYEAPEVKGAADFFYDYTIPSLKDKEHFYYGLYYYSQGMYQMGGKYAEKAKEVVRQVLLDDQQEDGSWPKSKRSIQGGRVYITSLSLLSLSIHYHYLPIYQR